MKTKIQFIIAIASIILSMEACTLERESYNEIYPENFFRNEDDVNKALAGLYYGHSEWDTAVSTESTNIAIR